MTYSKEVLRIRSREYYRAHKKECIKYVKKYQKTSKNFKEYLSSPKSQIRRKAQAKVNNSIKLGKITRQPCEVCGIEEAEAHHSDYHEEKWLDVQWLCKKHHLEWHKKNKPLYP